MFMELVVFMRRESMGTSSLLLMNTRGLNMCIGNLMSWINSLNIRWN